MPAYAGIYVTYMPAYEGYIPVYVPHMRIYVDFLISVYKWDFDIYERLLHIGYVSGIYIYIYLYIYNINIYIYIYIIICRRILYIYI